MKGNKILVCCLGGTIGSNVDGDKTIRLGSEMDKSVFEKLGIKDNLFFISPVYYSSENATIELYKEAFRGITEAVEDKNPDGVLVLHGTDSMAHFAQLLVRVLSFLNIPIVITGAKYPINDLRTDAMKNIKFAFNLLDAVIEGQAGNKTIGIVFNDSFMGESTFIPAQLVTDADEKGDYRRYSGNKDVKYLSEEQAKAFMSSAEKVNLLTIPDIPSYPVEAIDADKLDACLITAYHSGTADSERYKDFISRMVAAGKKVYLAPITENINKYESERELLEIGITPVKGLSLLGAWAAIVCGSEELIDID